MLHPFHPHPMSLADAGMKSYVMMLDQLATLWILHPVLRSVDFLWIIAFV